MATKVRTRGQVLEIINKKKKKKKRINKSIEMRNGRSILWRGSTRECKRQNG